MYKIFVKEKPLTFQTQTMEGVENLLYESGGTFDAAVDMLFRSRKSAVNIYHCDEEQLWWDFKNHITEIFAAGGIVENSEHKYLFINRSKKWDLPKGHIEKGESKETAALREVEEECSITHLQLGDYIDTTYHVYFDGKYFLKTTYWYAMIYSGEETPKPQTEENIEIADWFSKEEIPELMKNTYANIKHLIDSYLKL
ncbi:MAG: NUDIX domain-containing protein [Flavobacteriaceae bacterium]|jgi:8-oxo-dGTP pyrophosphatase MutT (NUDIX family)|nr:NUDIX domain-containing protein [Flavobacteriaceae bacterium]